MHGAMILARCGLQVGGGVERLLAVRSGGQSSVLRLVSASNLFLVGAATMLQKANASTTPSSSSTAAFLPIGLGATFLPLQQCAKCPGLLQFLQFWFQALHSFVLASLDELL